MNAETRLHGTSFHVMSTEVMPLGTRCFDFEWRLGLKKDDLCDISDSQNVWYSSTVLDVKVEVDLVTKEKVHKIYIGYRVYEECGEKNDPDTGKKFTGWSSKYDEWLPATSPRVSQYKSLAKKFFPVISVRIDPVVEDSNDEIYNLESYRQFAIVDIARCSSQFLIKWINRFG